MNENERPHFLAMYFDQPDTASHMEGPDSDAVNSALITVDAMINYLAHRLDKKGYLGCINVVLLSDHGGQKLRDDHFVSVERFLNISDPNVVVFDGAIGQVAFKDRRSVNLTEKVAPFTCQEGHAFRVYTRETMPTRYHYTNNPRIGDIVLDSAAGSRIFRSNQLLRKGIQEKGDHGYDNRLKEMRAIFGAYGPSIKPRTRIHPFQNIELYNLFVDLMDLPYSAKNNGTKGLLNPILKTPRSYWGLKPVVEVGECPRAELLRCGDGCHFELPYFTADGLPAPASGPSFSKEGVVNIGGGKPTTALGRCNRLNDRMLVTRQLQESDDLCLIRLCNSTMVYSRKKRGAAKYVTSVLTSHVANVDYRANCTAYVVNFDEDEGTAVGAGAGGAKGERGGGGGNGAGKGEKSPQSSSSPPSAISFFSSAPMSSPPSPMIAASSVSPTGAPPKETLPPQTSGRLGKTQMDMVNKESLNAAQKAMTPGAGREPRDSPIPQPIEPHAPKLSVHKSSSSSSSMSIERPDDPMRNEAAAKEEGGSKSATTIDTFTPPLPAANPLSNLTAAPSSTPSAAAEMMGVGAHQSHADRCVQAARGPYHLGALIGGGGGSSNSNGASAKSPTSGGGSAGTAGGNSTASSSMAWISLFSNNDYARYIAQGQIPAPASFVDGVWKQLLKLIRQYQRHYKQLVMYSGPIYDSNNDGIMDMGEEEEEDNSDSKNTFQPSTPSTGATKTSSDPSSTAATTTPSKSSTSSSHQNHLRPSHVFVVLMRCRDGKWATGDMMNCASEEQVLLLPFVLPLVERDLNCLFPLEYIFRHTARIRDIELLTGDEWFNDRKLFSAEAALRLRTQIVDQLWQLELNGN